MLWSGQSGRDGDQVGAQGGAAGEGVAAGVGEGAGGAEQVVADRGEDAPGGVGGEGAGGLVGPVAVDQVGPDGFADGVSAVGDVGLRCGFGVVGDPDACTLGVRVLNRS